MARLRRPFAAWLAFALFLGAMTPDRPASPAKVEAVPYPAASPRPSNRPSAPRTTACAPITAASGIAP